MVELPLVLLSGMLGSTHCIGMCGPIVAALGVGSKSWRSLLARQLAYHVGRIAMYATLGAMLAYGGWRLVARFPGLAVLPSYLAVVAGVLVCVQGLLALGVLPRRAKVGGATSCLAATPFAAMLMRRGVFEAFLAGSLTGFFPCGMLYAYFAIAASAASMAQGALVMGTFGLGAMPMLLATACGASFARGAARHYIYRVAACCVVITGLVCLGRGAANLARLQVEAPAAALPANAADQATDHLWCR